jgi:hypothetical protein
MDSAFGVWVVGIRAPFVGSVGHAGLRMHATIPTASTGKYKVLTPP